MSKRLCSDPAVGYLLHAYELGALSADDTETFELHLLSCEYCFAEVRRLQAEVDSLRFDPEVRDNVERSVASGRGVKTARSRLLNLLWPPAPLPFRPALLLFVLALLLYPAYHGLSPQGDRTVRPMHSVTLVPDRSGVMPSCPLKADHDISVLFIFDGAVPAEKYQLQLSSVSEHCLVWS
ncbi:MAG: zf-HC2 domain-containing protein, partial [candidate division Zixibacteria bacterium]|nr:zf-HC2 domain-containing protein [candidate division Zixibacteria bacterium]